MKVLPCEHCGYVCPSVQVLVGEQGRCPTCGEELHVKMSIFDDADEADKAELREEILDLVLFADDV
jgi:hypothetical protein